MVVVTSTLSRDANVHCYQYTTKETGYKSYRNYSKSHSSCFDFAGDFNVGHGRGNCLRFEETAQVRIGKHR